MVHKKRKTQEVLRLKFTVMNKLIDSLLVLSGMLFVFTVVGYVVGMFLTLL